MTFVRPSRHEWLICLLLPALLLLTWSVSRAALNGPFLFDDFPNFENLREISGCFNGDRLASYLAAYADTPGRPLAALSFLIDDDAWPSSPYSWKRHNLLLHLLCGVLVFGFTRTLARIRHTQVTANWVALGAAAAWLLHPMQLSTSMLTVQRMTQLMTLTSLSACWWVAYRLAKRPLEWIEAFKLLAFSAAMTIVAFLFKENGALLPLYLMVTSIWMLHRSTPTNLSVQRAYFAALWLPILAIIVALAYSALTHEHNGIRNFNPWERLLTESRILWSYLHRIVLPQLDGSGIFHDDIVVSRGIFSPTSTLLAILALLALFALTYLKRHLWPLLAFAVAWFFGGHLIESTTWPLELYFEHRNYLPMAGVIAAVAMALPLISSIKVRRASIAAASVWLAISALMTSSAASVWGSAQMQAMIWTVERPLSMRALEWKARNLVEHKDYDTADDLLNSGIDHNPNFGGLAIHALMIHCLAGNLTVSDLDKANSRLHGSNEFNRSTLAALAALRSQLESGICVDQDVQKQWHRLAETLLNNPAYDNNESRAYIHAELAKDGMRRKDFDATIRHMIASYQAMPNKNIAKSLAFTLKDGGIPKEAAMWQQRADQQPELWPIPWWKWLKARLPKSVDRCAAPAV